MKSLFCWVLITLSLATLAGADTLDDVLDRYATMSQGRVQFQLTPIQAGWKLNSTLVFRRPDRLHYWSEVGDEKVGKASTHVWLEKSQLWVWTSRLGQEADAPQNVYFSEPHEGGLLEGPVTASLGPANFIVLLLSGQRSFLELDPNKAKEVDLWTVDGDQMVFDPATRLLKQVIAWSEGQKMASASLEYSSEPVGEGELTFALPAGAKLYDPSK